MLRSRQDLRHLPVIFLTSLLDERERMRGYALGVDDYIDKPFEAQDLTERVERLLHRAAAADSPAAAERTLRGDLRHVSLASLLSFLEADRHSGILSLSRPGEHARIGVRDGLVRSVELQPDPTTDGEDLSRLFVLLDWDAGEFELVSRPFDGDDELGLPTAYILLEHARRKDDASRPDDPASG
jgi:hypothetical protein